MRKVNCQQFFSVQESSGREAHCFLSLEEATKQSGEWYQSVQTEFEKWEKGEFADVMVESTLESDLEGGCFQSFSVHPACLPGEIRVHHIGEAEWEHWKGNPGANKIRWGNPATERPQR